MLYRSNIPCKHPGCAAALIPHGPMYCEEHKPLHTKDRVNVAERGYGASGSVREGSFWRAIHSV